MKIINKNFYLNLCISNYKKDINSISYIIKYNLSQSDCIKLGNAIEKVLCDIIINENKNLKDIKPKNKKNFKEKDHLFIDIKNKQIYYAELKCNLYLDTEKYKNTISKCLEIHYELQNEYKDYNINTYLVGLRYYNYIDIPINIRKKYRYIDKNLKSCKEYLDELNIGYLIYNKEYYFEFLNQIAYKMLNNS